MSGHLWLTKVRLRSQRGGHTEGTNWHGVDLRHGRHGLYWRHERNWVNWHRGPNRCIYNRSIDSWNNLGNNRSIASLRKCEFYNCCQELWRCHSSGITILTFFKDYLATQEDGIHLSHGT
ncbi:hypothetical protein KC19_VG013600 [Ceratodon purpureus]|uniref:Uncharacterized protein n=1 Tax=Ceratodon purpureus TaxID=3225 RepID=A0A8T0HKZ2_CERPU|nr:hypothetical protein KC19_VG013600 [Ceratodon purpureus]